MKLKKDLPFAKAGTECHIDFEDDIYIETYLDYHRDGKVYLGSKEYLLSKDWIEEEKPREIWVNVYEGNLSLTYNSKKAAKLMAGDKAKTIKFIEVKE